MKNKLIINLTLLVLIIAACGGQATQTAPEPAAPTQAVTQPAPAPATAVPATDMAVSATEAPVADEGVSFANDV